MQSVTDRLFLCVCLYIFFSPMMTRAGRSRQCDYVEGNVSLLAVAMLLFTLWQLLYRHQWLLNCVPCHRKPNTLSRCRCRNATVQHCREPSSAYDSSKKPLPVLT